MDELTSLISAYSEKLIELFVQRSFGADGKTALQEQISLAEIAGTLQQAFSHEDLSNFRVMNDLNRQTTGLELRLNLSLQQIKNFAEAIVQIVQTQNLSPKSKEKLIKQTHERTFNLCSKLSVETVNNVVTALNSGRSPSLSITMHELRRPLTILSSYSQLLSAGVLGTFPNTAKTALEEISTSTDMMIRMVNALAEVSRLEDPQDRLYIEQLNPEEIVSDSIQNVGGEAQLREVTLRRNVGNVQPINGDRRRLTLALTNIISNAIKHSLPHTEVAIDCWDNNDGAHFVVRDKGPGFPPEDAEHLFDKYFRSPDERKRQTPGSGLGLFIVRMVAERHQGSVMARSDGKSGAEFELVIPLQNRSQKIPKANANISVTR